MINTTFIDDVKKALGPVFDRIRVLCIYSNIPKITAASLQNQITFYAFCDVNFFSYIVFSDLHLFNY